VINDNKICRSAKILDVEQKRFGPPVGLLNHPVFARLIGKKVERMA